MLYNRVWHLEKLDRLCKVLWGEKVRASRCKGGEVLNATFVNDLMGWAGKIETFW